MDLQDSVDRLARSLEVPKRLLSLHPRQPGNAGNYSALPPAVVLGVISAFEGFVEDFMATALYLRGYGMGQIAKRVSMNNPTVSEFQKRSESEFPGIASRLMKVPPLQVWNIPSVSGRPVTETIAWKEVCKRGDGWMEVRHCLTHGLASGWRSEVWPGPLKGSMTASSVLRAMPGGKHSIGLTGAISCARIYLFGAERIATAVATELDRGLVWGIPDFPVKAAARQGLESKGPKP
ncbi:terminase gpP N-terminus-related DNA-binding protein [Micromonospora sp. BQ11]|uniref:terminase gpP N-terminus-related DNA-binding protein n=1 Tax=Micromonospora sp. BQ11 TaxID=3452212 RepID=UPI003F8CCFE3